MKKNNNKLNKNTPKLVYNVRLVLGQDNRFKVTHAERRLGVNQHSNLWRPVNSRNLARRLNRGVLIIK